MQDAPVDLLSVGDEAFERAKTEALCIMPDFNVSEMVFFKIVVVGRLVDMKEASLEDGVLKDVSTNNLTHEDQEEKHHDV